MAAMKLGSRNQPKVKTWDEAFRGLIPVVRQESVRVADYTQVLFAQACEMPCYTKTSDRPAYLFEEFKDVAYKCGLYHQLGKTLREEDQQLWNDAFSAEEKREYYGYTTEGRELVARLQGDADDDEDGVDTAFLMVREACEQHLERWDGSGFPKGRQREEISLIGQIVALAKELDRLVCSIRSENPFEEAIGQIMSLRGTWFSGNLIDTMRECRVELKEIYKKYVQYTNTVRRTIPLVEMRPTRPFGLNYRHVNLNGDPSQMYEAVPWFRGVGEEEGALVTMKRVEDALRRIGMLHDVSMYLLYEAADTVLRLKNWDAAPEHGMIVHMSTWFYSEENALKSMEKLYADQPGVRKYLRLTISARFMEEAEPFIDMGVPFLLNGYRPEQIPPSELLDAGFDYVRISKKVSDPAERAALKKELQRYGVTVVESDLAAALLDEEACVHEQDHEHHQ